MKNQMFDHQIFALWVITCITAMLSLSILFANAHAAEWEVQNPSPTEELLTNIWASSDNSLFAVGDSGTIIHYDGNQWITMNSNTSSKLYGIWGSANNNVFTVGNNGTILHYDGNQWTTMSSGISFPLIEVWGSSSTDVFAVSDSGTIIHYDGNQWTTMNSGISSSLWGVWGSSSNNVFAVGNGGTIIHYDGNQWTHKNSSTFSWLNSIWGSSSQNVFAVGDDNAIVHYNGNQWTTMNSNTSSNLYGVWGNSDNEVFAVGSDGTIIHYDGSQWNTMNSNTSSWLWDITGNANGDMFAVGENGTILHYEADFFGCTDASATNHNLDATADDGSCEYNTAPVLNPISNQSVIQGETLYLTATATDAENDFLEFGLINAPADAYIDLDTGEFIWTPYNVGYFDLTVTVMEAYGTSSTLLSDEETITINVMAFTPSEDTSELNEEEEWQEPQIDETEFEETPEWSYEDEWQNSPNDSYPPHNENFDEEDDNTTPPSDNSSETESNNHISNEEKNLGNDTFTVNVNDTISDECSNSNTVNSDSEAEIDDDNCNTPANGGPVFSNIGNPSINLTVNVPAYPMPTQPNTEYGMETNSSDKYNISQPNNAEMASFDMTETTSSNHTLTITTVGHGSVISDGIHCGKDCTEDYVNETSLTLIALPENKSHFIAWAGHCNGTNPAITMTMNTAINCVAIFEQEEETFQSPSLDNHLLKLLNVGKGNGKVSSTLNGIDCGIDCDEDYLSGTVVTLTATAESGSRFTSWGGDCRGTTSPITVTIREAVTCAALFDVVPQHRLTLRTMGNGTVSSSNHSKNGISCKTACAEKYYEDSSITLTATPMSDSLFIGWKEPECADSLTMTAPKRCTAVFEKLPNYTLILETSGEGNGSITNTAGMDCGMDCVSYLSETNVALTAIADIDSEFTGWAGDCANEDNSVSFNITEDMRCTATFSHLSQEDNDAEMVINHTTDELPVLEEIIAINAQGELVTTDAVISGGVSNNGSAFEQQITQSLSDIVEIRGSIEVDSEHVGQVVDILVVIVIQPPFSSTETMPLFFMLDEDDNFIPWDGDIANLVSFKTVSTLTKAIEMQIYEGQFVAPGGLNIFFGYRLDDTVIYSLESLDVIIVE
ncbi:hypothetical protein [Candidatus Parabeggiatoa sp. HSG14]|uniref:InlB B-repeat-containing protein n=1 Tax=Candidatus Parabeggiatoa sp. HSG14 TaxID=3055593 RepID=UPI0025A8B754|nr:hypothetical protein [Thiotrichales bacterium HSG14]